MFIVNTQQTTLSGISCVLNMADNGGCLATASAGLAELSDAVFANNTAASGGGAAMMLDMADCAKVDFTSVRMLSNTALFGDAVTSMPR